MGLIAPAHELVDARAGLSRLHERREELLTPSGPQGPQKGYLDIAAFLGSANDNPLDSSYGIRQNASVGSDYLVGGPSQLQAALNLTTGMYMANEMPERISVMQIVPSRETPLGYGGCSNGSYNTCWNLIIILKIKKI